MYKSTVIIFFISLVLLSCHNRTNSHRHTSYSRASYQKESFKREVRKPVSTNIFRKNKKKVTPKAGFGSSARESKAVSGRKSIKGDYVYNDKEKKVTRRKIFFVFNNNSKEKGTSTFKGGKKERRNSLFGRKADRKYKKKKASDKELFDPGMHIKI